MEKNKKQLISVISNLILTNISIMEFYVDLTDDPNSKKVCRESIRQSKRALKLIKDINHVEILTSLYNTFVVGKETYFVTLPKVIDKRVKRWDTTKTGFEEFLKLEDEAKIKSKEEFEEREKQRKMVEQAKKEGKKVEMVLKDGKIVPVVVDQPKN